MARQMSFTAAAYYGRARRDARRAAVSRIRARDWRALVRRDIAREGFRSEVVRDGARIVGSLERVAAMQERAAASGRRSARREAARERTALRTLRAEGR